MFVWCERVCVCARVCVCVCVCVVRACVCVSRPSTRSPSPPSPPQHLDPLSGREAPGAVNEAAQQLAFADLILLNKTDLVTAEQLDRVKRVVREINHSARQVECRLNQARARGAGGRGARVFAWLREGGGRDRGLGQSRSAPPAAPGRLARAPPRSPALRPPHARRRAPQEGGRPPLSDLLDCNAFSVHKALKARFGARCGTPPRRGRSTRPPPGGGAA
jgi:hypothetical protein